MIEVVLIWIVVALLVITEVLGLAARRFGFITISETARSSRVLRLSVALAFVVGLAWWVVHSAPR